MSKPQLSPRELEIVQAVVAGHTNKEVSEHLQISEDTVKHHLSKIFDKLDEVRQKKVELLPGFLASLKRN